MKYSNCHVRFNPLKIAVENVLSRNVSINSLTDTLILHNPQSDVYHICIINRKLQFTFLPVILPNVHRLEKFFFAGRLSNKFVKLWLSKISFTHLKCIATLPCDLSPAIRHPYDQLMAR